MSVHWHDSVYMSIELDDHFFQSSSLWDDHDDELDGEYESWEARSCDPGNFAYWRPEPVEHPSDREPLTYDYKHIEWIHEARQQYFYGLGSYRHDVFSSRRVRR